MRRPVPGVMLLRSLRLAALLVAAPLLSGCLYTSHHFNSGRILEPGRTAVTMGFGLQPYVEVECTDKYSSPQTKDGKLICLDYSEGPAGSGPDTLPPEYSDARLPTFSLGYRLGVRGKWGPFTGVELGWHLEAPTNAASAEFDVKLGLPAPTPWSVRHSLSGGWLVGMWADNSFFAEYGVSRLLGEHSVFGNFRGTWLATQPDDLAGGEGFQLHFERKQRWVWQGSAGIYLRVGAVALIPDYFVPLLTVTYPSVPSLGGTISTRDRTQWNFNLAMGWDFK